MRSYHCWPAFHPVIKPVDEDWEDPQLIHAANALRMQGVPWRFAEDVHG